MSGHSFGKQTGQAVSLHAQVIAPGALRHGFGGTMERFMLSAFADEIDPMLDVQMDVLEKHGIRYIEMRGVDGANISSLTLDQARAVKARLDARGFRVSALGSPIGKIGIGEDFEPHLALFRHTLALAAILEAPFIRMFSFYLPHGEAPGFYRGEVMRRWTAFIEAAEGCGVVLLHENEKDIYGDTAERCLDLLRTMDCPFLKATFDPANFVQCGVKTFPEAYNLLREHIVYMHIKDALYETGRVVPAGEGEGRVADILRALKDTGWNGFLSLEPHLADSLPGGGPDQFAVAAGALEGLLDRIGRD